MNTLRRIEEMGLGPDSGTYRCVYIVLLRSLECLKSMAPSLLSLFIFEQGNSCPITRISLACGVCDGSLHND